MVLVGPHSKTCWASQVIFVYTEWWVVCKCYSKVRGQYVVLFFFYHPGPWALTQAFGLGNIYLHLLNYLASFRPSSLGQYSTEKTKPLSLVKSMQSCIPFSCLYFLSIFGGRCCLSPWDLDYVIELNRAGYTPMCKVQVLKDRTPGDSYLACRISKGLNWSTLWPLGLLTCYLLYWQYGRTERNRHGFSQKWLYYLISSRNLKDVLISSASWFICKVRLEMR